MLNYERSQVILKQKLSIEVGYIALLML